MACNIKRNADETSIPIVDPEWQRQRATIIYNFLMIDLEEFQRHCFCYEKLDEHQTYCEFPTNCTKIQRLGLKKLRL